MNDQHGYSNSDKQRLVIVSLMLVFITFVFVWREVDLHVVSKDFLKTQGDARYLREVSEPADRGMILDRNGEPLAISTPVLSVWANPQELIKDRSDWARLSVVLKIGINELQQQLADHSTKEFVYLKRQVIPEVAERIKKMEIPGVFLTREYRRYYPAGEVTAHVVGFTNIDDVGQEGIELALDKKLRGISGAKRVIKNRLGQIVEEVEQVALPQHGEDVVLTIDRRIQYLAYRELKAAVQKNHADSGTAVILDAQSGEILAMVNQPSYNPNNRDKVKVDSMRNRAITDVFEPGSTVKPFTIAAALESGKFKPRSIVDTSPGLLRVGHKTIHDARNYGAIDIGTIIQKSSNVGASKLALSIEPRSLWTIFAGAGFGGATGVSFPGESTGLLSDPYSWHEIERATLSYGYGLSVTALQLARAYTIFANDGSLKLVSLLRNAHQNKDYSLYYQTDPVLHPSTIRNVRTMMQKVVEAGGTGVNAQIPGYTVAGKTGTVKKSSDGGYTEDSYLSVFVGLAPASNPRLIMVIMIDEPRGDEYYGGAVAAPVFSKVMSGALRLLDVPPDDVPATNGTRLAMLAGVK